MPSPPPSLQSCRLSNVLKLCNVNFEVIKQFFIFQPHNGSNEVSLPTLMQQGSEHDSEKGLCWGNELHIRLRKPGKFHPSWVSPTHFSSGMCFRYSTRLKVYVKWTSPRSRAVLVSCPSMCPLWPCWSPEWSLCMKMKAMWRRSLSPVEPSPSTRTLQSRYLFVIHCFDPTDCWGRFWQKRPIQWKTSMPRLPGSCWPSLRVSFHQLPMNK